jgi:hypothetical protein
MNVQLSRKTSWTMLIVAAVVVIVAGCVASRSPNPFAVYSSHNIVAIVFVSLGLYLAATSVLALVQLALRYRYFKKHFGKLPGDYVCPGCGQNLLAFVSSHGNPISCPVDGEVWHNGCYSRGLPRVIKAAYKTPCPKHRHSTMDDDVDLMSGLGNPYKY